MRIIKKVLMESDDKIYLVILGEKLELRALESGHGFDILQDGLEIDWVYSREGAELRIWQYAVDYYLVVTGAGIHAGSKLWQLPVTIKKQVIDKANE